MKICSLVYFKRAVPERLEQEIEKLIKSEHINAVMINKRDFIYNKSLDKLLKRIKAKYPRIKLLLAIPSEEIGIDIDMGQYFSRYFDMTVFVRTRAENPVYRFQQCYEAMIGVSEYVLAAFEDEQGDKRISKFCEKRKSVTVVNISG